MKQFPRQYGHRSSANRVIRKYRAKNAYAKFVINKLDEGCYEVELVGFEFPK